jgi:hypothetical protein
MNHILAATITEARKAPDKARMLARLGDWQARVHALYDAVQASLDPAYAFDRSSKQEPEAHLAKRAGIDAADVPTLDILRIYRDDRLVAWFKPRMLEVIGANGRVDLVVATNSGGHRYFILFDHGLPLSGETNWRIRRPSEGLEEPAFRPERFQELLA